MYQVNPNDEFPRDNRGDESLHAGLLITATPTSTSRYVLLWRRTVIVRIFISRFKKTLNPNAISPTAPKTAPAYQAVQSVPDNEDDGDDDEGRFSRTLATRSRVAIDINSDDGDGDGDEGRFSRTISTRSCVSIDINSDSEDARTENNEAEQLPQNRNTLDQIVETKDLDALGGVEADAAVLESDLVTGINGGREAEVWNTTAYQAVQSVPDNDDGDGDEGRFSRTLSTRSRVAIDINSDSEEALVQIVETKDLDALRRFGGVEAVAAVLESDLDTGINGGREAEVWNTTADQVQTNGFFYYFFKACNSYTIFLLLISSGLCFIIETIEEGPENGWHDGIAILFAVFLMVGCSSAANFCRARKLEKEKLLKMNTLDLKVERGGKCQQVTISDIVEGDIVCLKKGDRVPADGLLVGGNGLVLDEVYGSEINCDENPFLFSGSKVVEGDGRMLVISVCPTALGKGLGLVTHDPEEKTLLETRIDKPLTYTDNVALGISVVISVALLIRLLFGKHDDNDGFPELKGKVTVEVLMKFLEKILLMPRGKIGILTTSLAAVVIGLQHGMPFVITVSLSYWNDNMTSDHVNLQNISAFGTMGLVTVICIDTTGGFMCKEMEVNKFWIGEKDVKDDDDDTETSQLVLETLSHGIGLSVHVPRIPTSPIDYVFTSWVKSRWGSSMEFPEQGFEVLGRRKLCCNKIGSGVLMRKNGNEENILHLHWKGEASAILGMCSHYYDCGGELYAMENQNSKFEQMVKEMEANGLTPIAYAHKQVEDEESRDDGLNLLAIVGFKCQCREEFKSDILALRNSGVSIILVSADDLLMVRAVASELGIFRHGSNYVMLEGKEFQELRLTLTPDQMMTKVDEIQAMGNFRPSDKLLLVQCLKERGHVVAFFGGLTTSDTLTLKEADIGISEKTCSTEMARENSDIVISAKSCSSLTQILQASRQVYLNIQKFIQLQLTASISGLLLTFISTAVSGKSPLTMLQLVWLNFIMCILGGLMLILKPQSQEGMTEQSAKRRTESLITKVMWRSIITQVLYQVVVLLIFQFKGEAVPGMTRKVKDVVIFNSFTLCQIFNQLNVVDPKKKEAFKDVLQNYYFLMGIGAAAGVQFLMIDFVTCLVDCVKLSLVQWIICFIVASLTWGFHYAIYFVSDFLNTWSFRSVGSQFGSSFTGNSSTYFYFLFIPFSMFLTFSLSYYFTSDTARTFR